MYHISFYVPEAHCEMVKEAMFAAGAGQIGDYSKCAWQTKGSGQFMPLAGSNPFVGKTNQIEQVEEYKVEMVCANENISAVIQALKKSHPYEEPAYYVIQSVDML
jgi:hypothetical protein